MREGDLVRYDGRAWIVRRCRDNEPTATLLDAQGRIVEVDRESDQNGTCQVRANPATDWPYILVRDNVKGQFMTGLVRTLNRKPVHLELYSDWVPSDPARPGGSVFLNPEMGIQPAETLLVIWRNGMPTSIRIPVHFGTVGQRMERAARKKPPEVTAYDRLMEDRFDEDE